MRKHIKILGSVGSAALLLSGSVYANPPTFGGWSVNAGVISDASGHPDECPDQYACSSPLRGEGFFQRQVRDVNGNTYFQTIITDIDATAAKSELEELTFYDESFVKALFNSGNASGITDKQHILQVDIDTVADPDGLVFSKFVADTNINSGDWAGDYMTLYQAVEDTHDKGFRTDFFFASADFAASNTNDSPDNMWMKITAEIGLAGDNLTGEVQYFLMAESKGLFTNPSLGSLNIYLPGAIDNNADVYENLLVSYKDDLVGTWISQDMSLSAGQNFSFEAYENKTTDNRMSKFGLDLTAASTVEAWPVPILGSPGTDGRGWAEAQLQRFPADPI